ncbi:RusA family crossover junction endodeoxyribonuclease [Tunicatimonas pelagia]|uniref:RusA family crossover junction endodeoxyribonuclease n=1 Tax=Tunicatimonas pelagia TaxID=931531 RepID=UPI002666CCA0|nr:hypothetical protein [Tunicatimonas pelagia]WKN45752.1 hypothetical protein P0M28_12370 [Tunicatimonas pelagia]
MREQFHYYNPDATVFDEDLYGIIIYFQQIRKDSNDPDADNISKPIWDSLIGECYNDDKVVRLRYAGVLTLSPNTATGLTLDDIDENIAEDFDELLSTGKSFVYIHIGILRSEHYKMKL